MTLLRQEYRDEIFGGLAARRIDVRHVLLAPEETILRARIDGRSEYGDPEVDARVREWCHQHLPPYRAALDWLAADAYTLDTSALTAAEAARAVADAVRAGRAAPCGIVQTPEPTGETLAAGVLLFDEQDRFLLVDPTYKPGWEFPGGVVEPGEPPARAGMREVAEEVGLELDAVPRLLLVDWERPKPPATEGCASSSTAAPSVPPTSSVSTSPAPNCAGGASSPRRRPRTCCPRSATAASAGRCAPANAARSSTWRRGPRWADTQRAPLL